MNTLTHRSNLDHLRKQAKDLLRQYREGDSTALERLRASLPAARGRNDDKLRAMQLRLHDMQSCIAREHGFASWNDLKDEVELRRARAQDLPSLRLHWLGLIYGGDIAGGTVRPRPALAARALEQSPELRGDDPWIACAVGDEAEVRRALDADPRWIEKEGGPLRIAPLIAITHSALAKLPAYRPGLLATLRLLLARGANPNVFCFNRYPPHSLELPGTDRLSALYGSAGKVHDVGMTRLLLAAGADADDGESLYHSVEDPDPKLPCTAALLEAGAHVIESNALAHILDVDNLYGLELLLKYTPHAHPDLGRILHWAIYRGRSAAHVRAVIDAGADPKALASSKHDTPHDAASHVLPEIMRLLRQDGTGDTLTDDEKFVAACARADETEARRLHRPGIFADLTPAQLKQLPLLAMSGRDDAVRLMVELGWPIATRGGDIDGSALNWAVFRGRPEIAEFLLEHGADYREPHGYGSDVLGTLCWASTNQPRNDGDWVGCAEALVRHGLPPASEVETSGSLSTVLIDGRRATMPTEVADVLLGRET